MKFREMGRSIEILLVEDNSGDIELTLECFEEAKIRNNLHVVRNGEAALAFLRQEGQYSHTPRPDLILLDLNLPRLDGREVLAEVKADANLRRIPVVVLTTSTAEPDIIRTYDLHANCYITKPVNLERFIEVIESIENFWLTVVTLPPS